MMMLNFHSVPFLPDTMMMMMMMMMMMKISGADGKNPKIFCLACKAWKPYATFGRHCNINHKQNDSQDVDETEVADKAEKGPLPKKKAEPKRTSRKEPVSRASEKGPKKKKTNINSGKPSKP